MGLEKSNKQFLIKQYIKTSLWNYLGMMTKKFQDEKMKTVADFYNKRNERALPEMIENDLGRMVIDLMYLDDKFFINDNYQNLIANDYP